jgi:hypothetical protein
VTSLVIQAANLSPEQKQFNRLLEKFESSAKKIVELNHLRAQFHAERDKKLVPLREQMRQWDTKLVLYLGDRLLAGKGLSKKQQENIAVCALNIGLNLLDGGVVNEQVQRVIDQVRDIYPEEVNALDDSDFDSFTTDEFEQPQDLEALRSHLETQFGVDLSDVPDLDNAEALWQAAMLKREAAANASAQYGPKKTPKKKSAKALAQEKEDADAQSTIKQIYRKLVSAVHPDREPDELKRLQKTALMAQINTANDKNDLFTMLSLQMQIEQIDPGSIASMADDKMRSYNRVLNDQYKAAQMEVEFLSEMIRQEFGLYHGAVNEKVLTKAVRLSVNVMTDRVDLRKIEYEYVQYDKHLKAWAKEQVAMLDDEFYL